VSSSPTYSDGLRHLKAVKLSQSKTGGKHKNSENDEKVGKITGQGLSYNNNDGNIIITIIVTI
jgi:hypothetical protein